LPEELAKEVNVIAKALIGHCEQDTSSPGREGATGGLRRAGGTGSVGRPRLNGRVSHETRSVRKQTLPVVPARRRPPRRSLSPPE
jgi:hypothetical protein